MNRSLWRTKGEVISTEQRALNNVGGTKGFDYPNAPIGLIGFGPNVSVYQRDEVVRSDCNVATHVAVTFLMI